jgi:hypothetical protein
MDKIESRYSNYTIEQLENLVLQKEDELNNLKEGTNEYNEALSVWAVISAALIFRLENKRRN